MLQSHRPSRSGPTTVTKGALALSALATALLLVACGAPVDPHRILAPGHVEATEVRVSTKLGGTLEWFPVAEGDGLEEGQELARFDTVDSRLALEATRAEGDLARAQLELLLAGSRAEDIAAGAAHVAQAEVELGAAERELLRFQGLLDSGSGTEKTRDDALTRRDAAARSLEGLRQRQRKLEAGSRRQEIAAARARVAVAEARMAQIEEQLRDATVRSPTAGRVTEKLVEQGELLAPGTVLLVATDLADARLVAYVGETDLGRIRLDQEATVVTDDGQRRPGRLVYISPEAEFTPRNVQTRDERVKLVYQIKIALDNDDGLFKPGMPAEAHLRPVPAAESPQPANEPGAP